nr:NrtA/SsuA/CpmA family ABC transporter substrate-binding protein [uncultured Dethiosulfovibrio sp.]
MSRIKRLLTAAIFVIIFTMPSQGSEKVGISVIKALMNVPTAVEQELGLFQKHFGDKVDLYLPELSAGFRQAQAMAAGQIEFANCMGSTSLLVAASGGLDIRILSVYSRSPEVFKILVNSDQITSISDLRGKTLGGPMGTVLHFLLASAIKKEGLSLNDVEFIDMPHDRAVGALLSGQIDGALATGPVALGGIKRGARELENGKGLVGGMTLVGVDGKTARERPDLIRSFVDAQKEAVEAIAKDPRWAWELLSKDSMISKEFIEATMGLYDFSPAITSEDIKNLEEEITFLQELSIIGDIELNSLIL